VNEIEDFIKRINEFVPRKEMETMIELAIARRMESYDTVQQNRHRENQDAINTILNTIAGFKGYVAGVFGVLGVGMTLILHFWK
jgi:hypothetical protein